jgi:methyl-accepting chemotaxis protein
MEWASIVWKLSLAVFLIVLSGAVVYLVVRLGSVLGDIGATFKSVEAIVDKEMNSLLKDVDQTVKELNSELPELLKNISAITASIQQISESEVQPITHNIHEMTDVVGQSVAKLDELVNLLGDFSQNTVKHAEYYRDQLAVPITDIISLWSGIKTGWEVFSQSRKPDE